MFQLFTSFDLDAVQILLWSVTYVLIIVAGFQSTAIKKASMPYLAGASDFAWELCALIYSRGFWGHILWLSLDIPIFIFCLRSIKRHTHRLLLAGIFAAEFILLICLFNVHNGMLYSAFAIDLIVAVCFLFYADKLSPKLQVPIAIFKLLGDVAAGIYYGKKDTIIAVIAVIVLACNSVYLYVCIERRRKLIVQAKSRPIPKKKNKHTKSK